MGGKQAGAVRLMQLEAVQAAIAIENAHLYEETERQQQEAQAIAELAKDINLWGSDSPKLASLAPRVLSSLV